MFLLAAKNFLGQIQLSPAGLPTSIVDIQKQFIGRQISSELLVFSLVHKNIIHNNRNVGFRSRLCYKCFWYWADLVYNNKEEGNR